MITFLADCGISFDDYLRCLRLQFYSSAPSESESRVRSEASFPLSGSHIEVLRHLYALASRHQHPDLLPAAPPPPRPTTPAAPHCVRVVALCLLPDPATLVAISADGPRHWHASWAGLALTGPTGILARGTVCVKRHGAIHARGPCDCCPALPPGLGLSPGRLPALRRGFHGWPRSLDRPRSQRPARG